MPPGKQAKEVKIEFKMEVNKMVSAMEQVQKSFKESTQNIDKMSDSFKNMETKLHLVNMKMADMTKNISAMTQTNMVMSKDIKESFATWGTLLNDNNQKIQKTIDKMVALNKQNQAQREEIAKARLELDNKNKSLDHTFVRLKSLNMGWNALRGFIQGSVVELAEFNRIVSEISSISGEDIRKVSAGIFDLSIKSGRGINELAKAIQDSANEGNNLRDSFDKINIAISLSNKSMVPLSTSIARIDDIVDQYGITAEKAGATLLGMNLSSERAQAVFARMIKDTKEAGIGFDEMSGIFSVLINKAGLAERTLQVGWRGVVNGLQDMTIASRKAFWDEILPNWNKLNESQRKYITDQFGLRQGDEVLQSMADHYEDIHKAIDKVRNSQSEMKTQLQNEAPSLVKSLRSLGNVFLEQANTLLEAADKYLETSKGLKIIVDSLEKSNHESTKSMRKNFGLDEEPEDQEAKYQKQLDERVAAYKKEEETLRRLEEISGVHKVDDWNALAEERKKIDTLQQQVNFFHAQKQAKVDSVANAAVLASKKAILKYSNDQNDIDIHRVATIKKFNAEVDHSYMAAKQRVETDMLQADLDLDKIKALQKKIELQKKFEASIDALIVKTKQNQSSEEFLVHLSEKKVQAHNDLLRLQKQLKDETQRTENRSSKDVTKDLKEQDHLLENKINQKKQELKLAFENKTINSVEYSSGLLQLNSMLVTMNDRNRAQEISNKLGIDSVKILEDRSELIKSIELSISKMNNKEPDVERKQDQDLRKITLQKRRAGRLTPADELKLLQEEATERRRIAGPLGVQQVRQKAEMEMHAYQQLADQFAQQGLANEARTQLAKAELIKQTRDKQIQAILDAETAESASLQKRREEWDRTHFTWREAGEATGQMLKSSLEQSIDVLITKTGSLKDVWKSFESQLLTMFAREALMQGIRMLLDFGGVTRAGKGFFSSVARGMGFSSGTGVGGVPGYASGTGMMGTDTVPAMLTPGEIVLDRNASDVFRGMAASGGGMGSTIVINVTPSLLGNRQELIALDNALSNASVSTVNRRRK